MRGNEQVIEALNETLRIELTAINVYFVQAKLCSKWGYHKLGAKVYAEAIEEMRHAESAIQRILFLDGSPKAETEQVGLGSNVKEMFESALTLETEGVESYNDAIGICLRVGDAGSREVLEHILVQTEGHVQWLEAQLHLIDEIGLDNYLADQMGEEPAAEA
jgi:bacterioferritin